MDNKQYAHDVPWMPKGKRENIGIEGLFPKHLFSLLQLSSLVVVSKEIESQIL